MNQNKIPRRSKDGKNLDGSISLVGKKAPKPKKSITQTTAALPLKARQDLPAKEVRDKPTYMNKVKRAPLLAKIGTVEYIIEQAQTLTEDQAVNLYNMTKRPDISWGTAQASAMDIFDSTGDKGAKRHTALQLKWDSNWPDFSKYYNDDAWDSAWNAMAWATIALELRGEITRKTYDVLTKPWRLNVGQIHAGDLEMTRVI